MLDETLIGKLENIEDSIKLIEDRFKEINTPDDLVNSSYGITILDAIAMRLQFIGENVKSIDKNYPDIFKKFPNIEWSEIIKLRDLISHHYDIVNHLFVYNIYKNNLPILKKVISELLNRL